MHYGTLGWTVTRVVINISGVKKAGGEVLKILIHRNGFNELIKCSLFFTFVSDVVYRYI